MQLEAMQSYAKLLIKVVATDTCRPKYASAETAKDSNEKLFTTH